MRELGVPALDLWEPVLQREARLTLLEDNRTTSLNVRAGKCPKLRRTQRTHGVNIRWLCAGLHRGIFHLEDCHTQRMSADMFTKHFVSVESWQRAIRLLGLQTSGSTAQLRTRSTACIHVCAGVTSKRKRDEECADIQGATLKDECAPQFSGSREHAASPGLTLQGERDEARPEPCFGFEDCPECGWPLNGCRFCLFCDR